jgi:hypothetical protein
MYESVRIACLYTNEKCEKAISKLKEENQESSDNNDVLLALSEQIEEPSPEI